MDEFEIETVFQANTAIEAHAVCNRLQDEGIRASVTGDLLDGAYGSLGGQMNSHLVQVPEPEHERARELLRLWKLI